MGIQLAVGLGPAWVGMSADMLASLSQRFTRSPLSRGPCLIIDRWSGLALDSTTDPHHRTRPVLWTVHGLAWQQWRLLAAGRGLVKIVSEHGAMVLTTDATAGDGSWVWLEKDRDRDDQSGARRPLEIGQPSLSKPDAPNMRSMRRPIRSCLPVTRITQSTSRRRRSSGALTRRPGNNGSSSVCR